jgi:chaperonin GroES
MPGKSNKVTKSVKVSIKPLADRVLVKPLSEEERQGKTKSGIIIPDTVSKERGEEGVVIAVGPGRFTDEGKLIAMRVKKGDRVIFSKYGPDEVKVDGQEYFIISEGNILAIVE